MRTSRVPTFWGAPPNQAADHGRSKSWMALAPGANLNRRHARKRRNLLKTIDFFFHRTRKSKVDCQERQVQSRAPTSNATFLPPTCGIGPFHKTHQRPMRSPTGHARLPPGQLKIESELGIDEQGRGNPTFARPGHRQLHLPSPIILYRSSKAQRSPRPGAVPHSVKGGRHFGGTAFMVYVFP